MSKHILVCSVIRSATVWLTRMFRANVDSAELSLDVAHEGFMCAHCPLARMLTKWDEEGIHISVGAGSLMIDLLYERFPDLQVALLVRDPIDQLMSMHNHGGAFLGHTHDTGLFHTAGYNWGALEMILATTKALGIDTRTWHFDYYTTPEGFKELAESFGLRLKPELQLAANTPRVREKDVKDFSPAVIAALKQLHAHPGLLSEAYAKAKTYADEKLGR